MNELSLQKEDARFFSDLLAASNSSIVITDPNIKDNPIIFVNSAFEQLTGYAAVEAIGKNCRFLQGEDRRQSARQILAKSISNGSSCECTLRNFRKNGEFFWNKLYIFPINDKFGRVRNYVGIQHDISTEKQLLVNLEEKTRLIESSSDAFLKISKEFTILEANAACFSVFGWVPEDLIGKNASCLVPDSRLSGNKSHTRTLMASRNGEYVRKDGSLVYIQWTSMQSLSTGALLIIGRDVTSWRRAEAESAEAIAHNASILSNMQEGYFSLDQNWCFRSVNEKASKIFLRTATDLLGKNIWQEFPGEVGGSSYQAYQRAVVLREPQTSEEFFCGKWISSRAYPDAQWLNVFIHDAG